MVYMYNTASNADDNARPELPAESIAKKFEKHICIYKLVSE